jgi:hypothetical protein
LPLLARILQVVMSILGGLLAAAALLALTVILLITLAAHSGAL